jgi:hypothetical protein
MATHTLAARAAAEMLGSLMTYCLAVGGVANALLPRTKGEGMGLLAIAIAAGMGIGLPIAMFYRVSWHRRRRCLLRLHRRSNPEATRSPMLFTRFHSPMSCRLKMCCKHALCRCQPSSTPAFCWPRRCGETWAAPATSLPCWPPS